jgi:hypothetical protein
MEAQRPSGLNYKGKAQRVFQQQALHFMMEREKYELGKFLGGAQCCPIGTGKTFVSIMLSATHLLDSEQTKKLFELQKTSKCFSAVNLVVCPDVVKNHWQSEIRSVWPAARVFHYQRIGKTGKFIRDGTGYSITDLHANSFVLISWECLAKEIHYANACEAGTHVFSLALRYWGRIIFDEGQFSGNANCLKFKMCNKLQSLYRWYQTATPKDFEHVAQFLGVDSCPIWQPSKQEIESQMSLPSMMSKNVPIKFSLVEQEYYNHAKMSDIQKQNFCKQNPYAETSLKVFVIEMLRNEITLLKESQVDGLYNLSLHQYFVLQDKQLGIKTLNSALLITQDKSRLTLDELEWKKRVAKFITTLLFFGDSNPDLIQLQTDNIAEYLAVSPKCVRIINAQKSTSLIHTEFKKSCKAKLGHLLMALWMRFVEMDITQDITKLDIEWLQDRKTSSKDYDNIHHQLDRINTWTKIICHLNSDYFTLYQKFSIVLANVHKKCMMSQCSRKLHILFEFCLMTEYEKSGTITNEMKINANKCYKDKLEDQFKAWKQFKKIGKENPFVKNKMVCPSKESCHTIFKDLLEKRNVWNEAAKSVQMIIDLQKNYFILGDISDLSVIQLENVETLKSLSEYDASKYLGNANSEGETLAEKIQHFDAVVPKLLVKCLGCGFDFGRSHIPIYFDCGHIMCDKCEMKRVETLDQQEKCGNCNAIKLKTCPICQIVSFREVYNQVPIGITVSDLYPIHMLENDRKLVKECKIHNVQHKVQDLYKLPTGCKIPRISELILNLIQNPRLQANGTNYSLSVKHRKILVFDSDAKFLRELFNHFVFSIVDAALQIYLLKDDHKIIDQFTSFKGSAVLFLDVIHTAGMHLVEADTVILCTPSEDPVVEMQAIGRAHRFGQKRPVSVYHCYIENSIEEKHLLVEFDQDDEDCVALQEEKKVDEVKLLQDDYYNCFDDLMGDKPGEAQDDEKVAKKLIEKPSAVKSMLQELQLEEHWEAFQKEQYEWLEDLSDLSHVDLDRLNVPKGRRGRIFNFLDNHNVKRQKRE